MRTHWILKCIKIMVLVVAAVLLFGFVVQQLWNWLMPALFGLHAITFVQALGLLVLSKILFGGFRKGGGGGRGPGRFWKHKMKERWEGMTEEQRQQFREGMRGRWCGPGFGRGPRHGPGPWDSPVAEKKA